MGFFYLFLFELRRDGFYKAIWTNSEQIFSVQNSYILRIYLLKNSFRKLLFYRSFSMVYKDKFNILKLLQELNHFICFCMCRKFGGVFHPCSFCAKHPSYRHNVSIFCRFESCSQGSFSSKSSKLNQTLFLFDILDYILRCRSIRPHARSGYYDFSLVRFQNLSSIFFVNKAKILRKKIHGFRFYFQFFF